MSLKILPSLSPTPTFSVIFHDKAHMDNAFRSVWIYQLRTNKVVAVHVSQLG
jgi:hypothetical protein